MGEYAEAKKEIAELLKNWVPKDILLSAKILMMKWMDEAYKNGKIDARKERQEND